MSMFVKQLKLYVKDCIDWPLVVAVWTSNSLCCWCSCQEGCQNSCKKWLLHVYTTHLNARGNKCEWGLHYCSIGTSYITKVCVQWQGLLVTPVCCWTAFSILEGKTRNKQTNKQTTVDYAVHINKQTNNCGLCSTYKQANKQLWTMQYI